MSPDDATESLPRHLWRHVVTTQAAFLNKCWNDGGNRTQTLAARLHMSGLKEKKLMNTQRKILTSVGVMLVAATASFAQQVKTDYDGCTDFSQYKT